MISITVQQALDAFTSLNPQFLVRREMLVAEWSPEELPPYVLLAEFAGILCANLSEWSPTQLHAVFATAEHILQNGDELAGELVATGFLESLLNRSSAGTLDFRVIADHLGDHSIAYCLAWDVVTDVQTPGLWT